LQAIININKKINMNKDELIGALASATGFTKKDSLKLMNAFIDTTSQALKKGDKIWLPGFGTFRVVKKNAREVRNPSSGAKIKVAAKNYVKFKAGTVLAKHVN
jgi:DNA-binding protein HU-beta